jgi:catechol 2,3-dioxygenase-like lactoylglutathione lyase family enzyme
MSVTDLDRSERFYTEVFDLIRMADFTVARVLLHRQTGFMLSIVSHEDARGGPFSELNTGLDHLGFVAADRDELVEWERKLETLGVVYTPIRDMEFGSHLNFRDPDNIALELNCQNDVLKGWLVELKEREIPAEEREARLTEYLMSLSQ